MHFYNLARPGPSPTGDPLPRAKGNVPPYCPFKLLFKFKTKRLV